MKLLAVLLLPVLLVGCATAPVSMKEADPAPPSQLMLYQVTPKVPFASVTLVRDSGWLAGMCRVGIYIDGEFAGSLAAKQRAKFLIPAGEHKVHLGQDNFVNDSCIWRYQPQVQTWALQAGSVVNLRISGDTRNGFVLKQVD